MSITKKKLLLDKLQILLQEQIRLVRQGNISSIEKRAGQAGCLMEKITESGILELPEFKNYREKLQRSYRNLCLALAAQKSEIAEELSQIRKGKKIMGAYRTNI